MQTRRVFLRRSAATAVAAIAGMIDPLAANYDLVIRGGRVVDPARRLDAVMDVAVARGRIAQILPPGSAVSRRRS